MLKDVKNYKNTTLHWSKSQGEIIKFLETKGILETRFTNIGYQSAVSVGIIMEKDTSAIMLEFMKPIKLDGGVSGMLPVKMIIPNIPNDDKLKNQAYRIFWHYLKNKFIGIDSGLIEFEQEFMPHISIGQNSNVWQAFKQKMLPQIVSGKNAVIGLLGLPEVKD